MRTPSARLRDETSRRTWDLGPGAIIGRMVSAACRLTDSRVSEAHALVSLRGRALRLLALRGEVLVDGAPEDEVELAEGQVLTLGATRLAVIEVTVPEDVLALRIDDGEPQELCAGVYALVTRPAVELVPREEDAALARVWSTAEGWCLQTPDGKRENIVAGRSWQLDGVRVAAVLMSVEEAGRTATVGRLAAGLTIVARHTSTHLLRAGREPVVVDGQPGRVISELATMGAPVDWTVVATAIWPELDPKRERDALRRNWDRVTRRLRLKLREHGIREDLVRADGLGNLELVLQTGDRVRDET